MYEILMVVYLVVAIALVGFILVQQGKGAGMGSAFGSGASGTVFGASGSGNFLTKTTTFLAIVFFGVALGLGNLTSDKSSTVESNSLFTTDETAQPAEDVIPNTDNNEIPVLDQTELPQDAEPQSELPQAEEVPAEDDTAAKKEDETDNNS